MAQAGRARSGSNPTDPRCGSPAIALRTPALRKAGQKAGTGTAEVQPAYPRGSAAAATTGINTVIISRSGPWRRARETEEQMTKKTKIEFNVARHHEVKSIREVGRSLRELENAGLVVSRVNPFTGGMEWRITEKGIREAGDLASIVSLH
jgi:hypothetical protein